MIQKGRLSQTDIYQWNEWKNIAFEKINNLWLSKDDLNKDNSNRRVKVDKGKSQGVDPIQRATDN